MGRVKQAAAVAYVAQCRRPARTIHTHVGTRARTEASGSLAALPSRHAAERNGGGVQPPPLSFPDQLCAGLIVHAHLRTLLYTPPPTSPAPPILPCKRHVRGTHLLV